MKDDTWFVYVLRCGDDTIYTGIAKDVEARFKAHELGKGARYTRGRGPLTLIARAKCGGHGEALRVELAFKRLAKSEKLALAEKKRGLSAFAKRVGGARPPGRRSALVL